MKASLTILSEYPFPVHSAASLEGAMGWMRLPPVALLVPMLCGCVTVPHRFGGQQKQADAEAAVGARFPIGTRADDVRPAMVDYGYTCRYYPAAGNRTGGLDCGDPRPVKRAPTLIVGGVWDFDFQVTNGAIASIRVSSPFSPYS